MLFFARLSIFVFGRGLVGGTYEARVAASAASALRRPENLTSFGEIEELFAGRFVVDYRANRDAKFDRLAIQSAAIAAFAMAATLSLMFRIEAVAKERVFVFAGGHGDIATTSTVTAGGTSAGDKFLTAKRKAAISAIARFDQNFYFVYKHKYKSRQSAVKQASGSTPKMIDELENGLFDFDETAHATAIAEPYYACDLGEERIVLT